jgi:hypothetical protein
MTVGTPTRHRSYDFHGVRIDVRADDEAVLDMMDLRLHDFRARTSPCGSALRLDLGSADGGSPTSLLPARAGRPVYETPYGSLHYFPETDVLSGRLGGVYLRCEPRRGTALVRGAELRGRALYFATHPIATISLMELLERRGLFSLHAACLATSAGGGVLLSGPSGAGKSTLALALARAGMLFLSDDVIFLTPESDGASVRALGFSDTVGLTGYASEQFAELRDRVPPAPPDGFPKVLVRIEDLFGASAITDCEPHALIFPEVIRDERSVIAPLDSGEALLRVVPDVLLTEARSTQAHLAALAALLNQVRCYEFGLGRDLERAAQLVLGVT